MSLTPVFGGRRSNGYEPFSRDAWDDPFNSHQQVQRHHYSESAVIAPTVHGASTLHAPSPFANGTIDWKQTPEAHIFKIELPAGVRREDVRVEVEDDKILKISGERFLEKDDRHDQYWRQVERSRDKFVTAFMLPEDSRADQIRSTIETGVLTVRVPRWEAKHHYRHVIPVEII